MGCNVEYLPLGDIVSFESGGTPDKNNKAYWNGDIPWISAKTLIGDSVETSGLKITRDGLAAGSRLAPKGSILLLTRGSGLFKRIPLAITGRDVAYNQDIKCLQSKREDITNQYIFYALKSQETTIESMLETTGIGAGKLSTDLLRRYPLPVLGARSRDVVVRIIEALGQKIAINQRTNDYLLELCAARYDHARRKVLLGAEGVLTDLVEVNYGKDHKRLADGLYPVYGSGGLMRHVDKHLHDGESVLIPRKGSLNNVMLVDGRFWTVDTMFFTKELEVGAARYAYFALRKLNLASMNSGSAVPSMTTKILSAIPISMPTSRLLETLKEWSDPLFAQIRLNERECTQLEKLRDLLLPKLMSGEIDVSEVDLPTPPNNHLCAG